MRNLASEKSILIKHLVDVEDSIEDFIADVFPVPSTDKDEVTKLLKNYCLNLEKLVLDYETYGAAETFPLVIIGCLVDLCDIPTKEQFTLRIVSPFYGIKDVNDVSLLSPVGRNLLLKKVGETIKVKIPAGECNYKILSITPDFQEIAARFYSKHV